MAIKVVVARDVSGSQVTEEVHADAEHFVLRDGVLCLLESHFRDAPCLASCAPGQWSSVWMLPQTA